MRRPSAGELIVATSDAVIAKRTCGLAELVIIDDATIGTVCGDTKTRVIPRRDLARRGSAMVPADGQIVFAIGETYRPWHDHRRFSREARGMAPWKPKLSTPKGQGDTEAPREQRPDKPGNARLPQLPATVSMPLHVGTPAAQASTRAD